MQFDVKIRKVIENGKPLKAVASVTVDGAFVIHNVRVIETEKTCSVCESEFDSLLVQLLVSLYAKQYNMRVVTFDDNIIGLPVETYIPDMFSVIERINKRSGNENERAVKEHLCKMNGISYYEVSANNHYELADKIKKIFQKKNIYILSNSQEDIEKCKRAFFKWKDITQQ